MTPKWTVELHDSLAPVEADWRALVTPENATKFQCHGVLNLLFREARAKKLGTPLVALVRYPDGRPAALFPMFRIRRHGLNWLVSDLGPLDYAAPIIDMALGPEDIPSVIAAMLAAVPGIDLAYFIKLPERFNDRPNPMVALPNAAQLRVSSWQLMLEGRTEDELVAAQSRNFRRSLGRRIRKLGKDYKRESVTLVGDEITEADYRIMRELHGQRSEELGRESVLQQAEWIDFYEAIARGESAPCKPWLTKLCCDGEVIATLFGLTDGHTPVSTMVAMKPSPQWQAYSPGQQVFQESILYFHSLGARLFDMSVGDMSYKRRFGSEELKLYDALFPKTLLGHAYNLFWRLRLRLRNRMRTEPSED